MLLSYRRFLSTSCWNFFVDAQILQLAGISKDLGQPKDFAYDVLVLYLASSETVRKVDWYNHDWLGSRSSWQSMHSLYFLRIGFYSVNTKVLDANMRVYIMWCYMIYRTSIKNICIIAKSKIVTYTIGTFFPDSISGVPHPRHATSEPS